MAALICCGAVVACSGSPADKVPVAEPSQARSPGAVVAEPPPPGSAGPLDAALSEPVRDPYYPGHGVPYFDALAYALNLDWTPPTRQLRGTATIRFRVTSPRSALRLDLGRPLLVRRVLVDGTAVRWTHPADHLVVETRPLAADSRHTLVVRYAGSPRRVTAPMDRRDVSGLGWTTRTDGSVWTMQEPWGAYTWYPVNDHPSDKAYYSATITSRGGMTNVFNGNMVSSRTAREAGDRVTTTRWRLEEPTASYLVTVAIGDYQRYVDTGPHGLPLTYWVPRDAATTYLPMLRRSPSILRWVEARLGRYPFPRTGAVVVPSQSAMETQEMVTIGRGLWLYRGGVADLMHEYTHSWFGDTVTTDNWPDLWLNEGLTMYMQVLWQADHGGPDVGRVMRRWAREDNQFRAMFGPPGAYRRDEFASFNVYASGALMLDRIRNVVGDKKFWGAMRAWPVTHESRSVDRGDFEDFMSRRTGMDLHAFVEAWLTDDRMPSTNLVTAQ
jgi:aminopeptidase N